MSKTLVACFSPTGTTKRVADCIVEATGADEFEIKPAVPYTAADLDWHDAKSRTSVEMNDSSCRPEIAGTIASLDQYDLIYVGFPIWWYTAPMIIHTFFEQYDWTGKKVVLFATSGGSGLGDTAKILEPSAKGATFVGGRCFPGGGSKSQIVSWVESL